MTYTVTGNCDCVPRPATAVSIQQHFSVVRCKRSSIQSSLGANAIEPDQGSSSELSQPGADVRLPRAVALAKAAALPL